MTREYCPVVVGVDGSPESLGALRWAADEAVRHTRQLHVVHARETTPPRGTVDDVAARAAAEAWRWLPGVHAVACTDVGSPVEVLRRRSASASLVVVGSRGGGVHGTLGSVSEALSVEADCPVLVVHDGQRWAAPDTTLPTGGPIVAGFDGTDAARRALRLAFGEAAARVVRLVTIHVWRHPQLWHDGLPGHCADLSTRSSEVDEVLRRAVRPWRERYPHIEVELRSQTGEPAEVLTLASQWAQMLVLGVHGPGGSPLDRAVLGAAACPVLLAHATPAAGADRPASRQEIASR